MNYYPRHIGDYIKDTAHLTLLEHGVYSRLLDVYYSTEAPIQAEQAFRLIGARTKEERAATQAVLNEFFKCEGNAYRHARCDRELDGMLDKQRKSRASAAKRWDKQASNANASPDAHANADANASPDAMRTHSEGNAPNTNTNTNTKLNPLHPSGVPPPKPARAVRKCPEGFAVTVEMLDWARLEAPDVACDAELAKFSDHTFRSGIVDWPGAWRNWMRKAQEFAAEGRKRANGSAVEPQWRREQREHREAFLGPAAATAAPRTAKKTTAEMETIDAPRLVG